MAKKALHTGVYAIYTAIHSWTKCGRGTPAGFVRLHYFSYSSIRLHDIRLIIQLWSYGAVHLPVHRRTCPQYVR